MEHEACIDCAITLTDEEKHYYEYRCEDCEQTCMRRLDAWMKGGEDTTLDALYSA
mgnify:CR=1 FL=1